MKVLGHLGQEVVTYILCVIIVQEPDPFIGFAFFVIRKVTYMCAVELAAILEIQCKYRAPVLVLNGSLYSVNGSRFE